MPSGMGFVAGLLVWVIAGIGYGALYEFWPTEQWGQVSIVPAVISTSWLVFAAGWLAWSYARAGALSEMLKVLILTVPLTWLLYPCPHPRMSELIVMGAIWPMAYTGSAVLATLARRRRNRIG